MADPRAVVGWWRRGGDRDLARMDRGPGRARLKAGEAVRNAFKPVVAEASRSTVRVLADGKQVTLGVIVGANGWVLTKASELKGKIGCRLKDERLLEARCTCNFYQQNRLRKGPCEHMLAVRSQHARQFRPANGS